MINDACQLLSMFHDIATSVGKYLNNDNWVNTVNNFGQIDNRGTGPYSSLSTGKYDADDNLRLVQYDSSLAARRQLEGDHAACRTSRPDDVTSRPTSRDDVETAEARGRSSATR